MLNKKKIFSIIILISVLCFTILTFFIFSDQGILIERKKDYLYADNSSTLFYKILYANYFKRMFIPFKLDYEIKGIKNFNKIKLIKSAEGFYLKSGIEPCEIVFEVIIGKYRFKEKLNLIYDYEDFDKDGFPDVSEIVSEIDRHNFIEWFVSIAESLYYKKSFKWEKVHHDCAGFINFCYKEALKKHDNEWYKNFPYLINKEISDVSKFNYPEIPILHDQVFRTKSGVFKLDDLSDNTFQASANANNLLNYNLVFISKSTEMLEKGDILFYNVVQNIPESFHSMIYIGNSDYLVYHTGQIDENSEGELRKVSLKDLLKHPDSNWHPEESNPNFLGIYRWRILI